MKPIGYIYLTTCIVNGKIYVGKHEFNGKYYLGSGELFKKAVKKYGKDKFNKKILRLCYTLHELRVWEHVYIVKYNATDRSIGYNIAKGDVNKTEFNPAKLPEVREKIRTKIKERNGLMGENNPMYRRKWSESKRKQMTELFKNNHPMKGHTHSEETKKHWSEIRKGKDPFRHFSDEQRKAINEKLSGENNPMYGSRFTWINNGERNKRLNINEPIPEGWEKGYIRK